MQMTVALWLPWLFCYDILAFIISRKAAFDILYSGIPKLDFFWFLLIEYFYIIMQS